MLRRWLFVLVFCVGGTAALVAALCGNGAALLLVVALALASPVVRAIGI